MIIVRPNTTNQISVYSRREAATSCVITREQTNLSTTVNVSATYSDGITIFTLSYTFNDDEFYFLEVKDSEGIINRSKLFCTTQTDYDAFNFDDDYNEITKTNEQYYVRS